MQTAGANSQTSATDRRAFYPSATPCHAPLRRATEEARNFRTRHRSTETSVRCGEICGKRGQTHVFQSVVHPAHIPLQAEAEAAHVCRPRDHRPGRRFFGDRLDVVVMLVRL